ncbi:hypothetical protein [Hymenobacter sp. DG25B]|uniref:hypothetical protein n=1 Tax=Hymenobacter sp. DG25B TaxID=1385664 RepID=UPI0012E0376E|nr:hypothetical protein [Hymenobacter sp. DG25B]
MGFFSKEEYSETEALLLNIARNPISGVVMTTYDDNVELLFSTCDVNSEVENFLTKLKFKTTWFVRQNHSEFFPYRVNSASPLFKVKKSKLLLSMIEKRSSDYEDWKSWDKRIYHHFLFLSDSNYIDIIAEEFILEKASELENIKYKTLVIT